MGEVAAAVVPALPMATVMVMVMATPSVVLVLTTATMVTNAGLTVLLPTGCNDQAILEHCREWEENADPDGSQFPRAKRHDDKAIAAIRFT